MDEMDDINIVPLVDIMLVLLTIVLTTATFVVNGRIPVDLARATHTAAAQQDPVVLTMTAHKALYLNDAPVTDLASALQGFAPERPVLIRADGHLELSTFVELADRVKTLGHPQVSLEVGRP